jgi:hypothetical protein
MKPPITKLVDKIIRKLQQGETPSEAGIRTWLKKEGYASKDVEAAIAVLRPEWGVSAYAVPQQTRVLSPYEAYFITPEAMAALSRLELYGLIGPAERELILERLDQFEGEMDIAALEYLISSQVCPGFDIAHQQMFYQVLDGRTDTYH